VWQRDDVLDAAGAPVPHLGLGSRGREVVEQHDDPGHGHGARRPGDDGQVGRRPEPEELHRPQQHADMTARDRQHPAALERLGDLALVLLEQPAAVDGARLGGFSVEGPHLGQVPRVETADRVQGVPVARLDHVGPAGPAAHGVDGVECVVQPGAVDAGQVVDGVAQGQQGRSHRGVPLDDLHHAGVQVQVTGTVPHDRVELGVVILPLLPPRGEGGDGTVLAQAADDGPRRREEPLGPEQVGDAHPAWTRTVRPTSSSIPRRTS